MKTHKIPAFKNEEELAKFWDTHDLADYWDELEVADDVVFEKSKKETISLRLDHERIKFLKRLAHKLGLGYTSLIRSWIIERISKLQT